MTGDVLVALTDRDQLDRVLPAVHLHALGHVARVLDARRGEITGQLRRAGVPVEGAPEGIADAPLALMIAAAARCPSAARLMLDAGIDRLWVVSISGGWSTVDDAVLRIAPRREESAFPQPPRQHIPVPGISDRAAAVTGDPTVADGLQA